VVLSVSPAEDAYDRGRLDGAIAERLGDQAISRDATVVTTAAALKDAEDARRSTSERSWTPVARVLAFIGGASALVAVIAAVLAWTDIH
jgi:hypothetical protein